ncbi:juvenile hormone esterase-like [Vanessa atalanta]|uniref:juvenile hormone esterase-like n=1 Tax=Vanessa atalanta TaxID=42275 RepID=UPI001FCD9F9B|nr:juvenile hormone esterase-like [Vanessa atalanta]
MWRTVVIFFLVNSVLAQEEDFKTVALEDGIVRGEKYWDGEFYQFFGIPYATIPKGRDRFQAPLPVEPWEGELEASKKTTICHQCYYTGDNNDEIMLDGEDECLLINLLVPKVASDDNLVPVVVYIHSGAFSGGSGNMAHFNYLARHDVITVSFNYRLGAFGFACLGNKEIPGNAGLKDQVAALRWINKNIKNFGGDPNQVTLAGFSVGAAMAELLSLSEATTGLFNKLILESGSALSPFTINRDPLATAKNVALSLGYNGTDSLDELTEFYLNATVKDLAEKSLNYYLKNSTFGFAPCIENIIEGIEPTITESPLELMKKGFNKDIAIITGFSNMEGISRTIKFGEWREDMNDDFSEFLPADLKFNDEKTKNDIIREIKQYYFDGKEVKADTLHNYVNYFSDSMFKYSIMRSAKLRAKTTKKPVYVYQFSFVGKLNIEHNYMDRLKGASHRDQTAYVLDFFGWTNNYKDLDTRERMTMMWSDFVKYENPTAFETTLIPFNWLPYTNEDQNYMEIDKKLQMKMGLFDEEWKFWNKIYEKYYWNPTAPRLPDIKQ